MGLHERLECVVDQASFLAFVRALAADRVASDEAEKLPPSSPYGPAAGGWENVSIESFLEAALAWAEDSDFGARQGEGPSGVCSWRKFAVFLYCGKIYE